VQRSDDDDCQTDQNFEGDWIQVIALIEYSFVEERVRLSVRR
jgi:hypothetical protein